MSDDQKQFFETRPKCPKCNADFVNDSTLRTHMTGQHGGYTMDELKAAGVKPSRKDIARHMAGDTSGEGVSKEAPDKEIKSTESGEPKRRRSSKTSDPAIEEAKERILRARCERIASLPYSILASLTGEDDIRLDANEKADITEAYITLSKAYGWEGTSKLILWSDVMICTAAPFAKPARRAAIKRIAGMTANPQEEETSKEEVIQ